MEKQRAGDHAAAIDLLNQALQENPRNTEAYCFRGLSNLKQGQIAQAHADFGKAIAIDPTNFTNYHNITLFLSEEKRWDDIISYWSQYISAVPTSGEAYVERAHAYAEKGNKASERKDYEAACSKGFISACAIVKQP